MLASSRIQSRCFLEPACLPAWLPHPIPTLPQPSADSHTQTHSRPALGLRAMFICACLPPAPGHTCAYTHIHISPPTPLLPGWSQITLGFPATMEAVSPPLPPSPFPKSSPSQHCLNVNVSSFSPLHPSTGQARSRQIFAAVAGRVV